MSINMKLAEAKGLDKDTIVAIETVHNRLTQILNRPTYYGEPEEIVKIVEGIEYTLQLLWGFPLDRNFHKWWNRIKDCKCPMMDNDDMFGSEYRIYNSDCPYHGAKNENNVR